MRYYLKYKSRKQLIIKGIKISILQIQINEKVK